MIIGFHLANLISTLMLQELTVLVQYLVLTGAIYGIWPDDWAYRNIAILEFYPIVLSLYLWGQTMSNKHVLFFTDNNALIHVINKCYF